MRTVKEANEQIISDQDIIEAYKNCQIKGGLGCYNCPFDKDEDHSCLDDLREATFNLIQHQKAEIERLKKELMKCKLEKEMLHQTVEEIKFEAIKEFCEKRGIKYVEDDV